MPSGQPAPAQNAPVRTTTFPPTVDSGFRGISSMATILSTTPVFQRLSNTNDCPSSAEEATIRATIVDLDAQLGVASDLTNNIKVLRTLHSEQIKRIDVLLPEIKESSQLLIHALTTHKKLLSPIRRIPAETLRHIFSFTVEFQDQLQRKETHVIEDASGIWSISNPHKTLWTLELACKRWRHESLGYPQLWAQITIVFSNPLRRNLCFI
ncbi:hypothetical protein CPB85DRAFT_263081 [Mucidula mucida]|nr:hypothetical protein CPB85DRAFT_263081 [Mucidula mucida]